MEKTLVVVPARIQDAVGSYLEYSIAIDIIEMELKSWLDDNDIDMTLEQFMSKVTECSANCERAFV